MRNGYVRADVFFCFFFYAGKRFGFGFAVYLVLEV